MAPEPRQLDLRRAAAALAGSESGTVTMAAVAQAVGVAKPTLYRLVGSREALVAACIDAEAERLLEHVHGEWPDLELAVERFAAGSPGGFVLLFGGRFGEARAATRRVEDRVRDLLRREARAGGDAADARLEAAGALGRAVAITRRRLEDGAVA